MAVASPKWKLSTIETVLPRRAIRTFVAGTAVGSE